MSPGRVKLSDFLLKATALEKQSQSTFSEEQTPQLLRCMKEKLCGFCHTTGLKPGEQNIKALEMQGKREIFQKVIILEKGKTQILAKVGWLCKKAALWFHWLPLVQICYFLLVVLYVNAQVFQSFFVTVVMTLISL